MVHVQPRRELYTFTISQLLPIISYEISVAAVNEAGIGVYSSPIPVQTKRGAITLTSTSSTENSITVSWTINHNVIPTRYGIAYSNINTTCFTDKNDIDISELHVKEFTITNLEEFMEYNITVSVLYSGVSDLDRVKAMTLAAGEWKVLVAK